MVPSPIDGAYDGVEHGFASGSSITVADAEPLRLAGSFVLSAWVYPTAPGCGRQTILAKGEAYGLGLAEGGRLELGVEGQRVDTGVPLRAGGWHPVTGRFDRASGRADVVQEPLRPWPGFGGAAEGSAAPFGPPRPSADPLLIGACAEGGEARRHFNGKIDGPEILAGADDGAEPVARWDLALTVGAPEHVADRGPFGLDGTAVNMPLRAVTGRRWSGEEHDFRRAPEHYSAIHFHDDDLEDAGWPVAFELNVPDGLPSGVYAARLSTGRSEDHLPFVIRRAVGAAARRIGVLVPTLTYVAYGSEHVLRLQPTVPAGAGRRALSPFDRYAAAHRLRSLYDLHGDGTGAALTSRLRPITNLRPRYVMPAAGAPHGLSADLHLVDWLAAKGHEADFFTDEDLHHEGRELLEQHRVVLTGAHPEYWTTAMLAALEAYLDGGGRLMYLGGNGLYWVTAVDAARPHVIEVRRGQRGSGTWRSPVGENHLAATGELGGLWRERGRPPQRLVGVGIDRPRASVAPEPLPTRARKLRPPRAAGSSKACRRAGRSANTACASAARAATSSTGSTTPLARRRTRCVLATARGFDDDYQHVIEEVPASDSLQGGSVSALVRADMVFFETPAGGAVFSTGSIAWCGSLSHNGYRNHVSRITDNVLRAFASHRVFGPVGEG